MRKPIQITSPSPLRRSFVTFNWIWLLFTTAAWASTWWSWPAADRPICLAYCVAKVYVWFGLDNNPLFFKGLSLKAASLVQVGNKYPTLADAAHQVFVVAPLTGLVVATGLTVLFLVIKKGQEK